MDLDIPQNTMTDIMAHHAVHAPDRTALVFGGKRNSWGEMNKGINRVANRLLAAGIRRGDKVATVMRTTEEHFCVLWGTMKAGAVIVPISDLLAADQIAGLIQDAGARFLFTDEEHRPIIDPALVSVTTVRPDGFLSTTEGGRWSSIAR